MAAQPADAVCVESAALAPGFATEPPQLRRRLEERNREDMKLESIAKGALVSGIEEGRVVRVVSADPLATMRHRRLQTDDAAGRAGAVSLQ